MNVKKLIAVIPWLGYSKQDKTFHKGETASVELVAKFIEVAGFDEVIALELHSENITPFFRVPVVEISTHALLASKIDSFDNSVVVSPDKGGETRSERFAKAVSLPLIHLNKTRYKSSGDVIEVNTSDKVGKVNAIIFDDIVNTASTAIEVSKYLKNNGALTVTLLATHAVFAGDAAKKLEKSSVDRVIVTDSIDNNKQKDISKLEVVSVSKLLASKMKQMEGNK